jgi:hypothetical protein
MVNVIHTISPVCKRFFKAVPPTSQGINEKINHQVEEVEEVKKKGSSSSLSSSSTFLT